MVVVKEDPLTYGYVFVQCIYALPTIFRELEGGPSGIALQLDNSYH